VRRQRPAASRLDHYTRLAEKPDLNDFVYMITHARLLLRVPVGILLLALFPLTVAGQSGNDVFVVTSVAPGVYAAEVKANPGAYAFANSLVVVEPGGVLVVDTQQSPTAARALLDEIRTLTDAPVRWVINTHWHGDHVFGNQAYADAFPDVRFVGHESTRSGVIEDAAAYRDSELAELPATIEARRQWLDTGLGPDGTPLTEDDRLAVGRSLRLRTAYLEDLRTLRLIPPDLTFSDRLTIHLGERRIDLIHAGSAHTRGDIVVHLPREGILAVGDLLEEAPPWLEGADIPGWAAALERLGELDVRGLLPSHGSFHGDRALLDWQGEFFRALVDGARTGRAGGRTAEAVLADFDLERFASVFAELGVDRDGLKAYVRGALERTMEALEMEERSSSDERREE